MVKYKEILTKFDITNHDKDNIRKIGTVLINKKDKFSESVINFICKKYDMPTRMRTILITNYKEYLDSWFENLLNAKVSNDLIIFMMDFNTTQTPEGYYSDVKIATIFSFIRRYLYENIHEITETDWEYQESIRSFTKIIDLSLYMVNHDYMIYKSGSKSTLRFKDDVIRYSEIFSTIIHTILIMFLALMTTGGIVYFIYDLFKMATDTPINNLFITALGSLLIVWVLAELMHSEIQMLKGDRFKISIFVGVVLIAFIRDLLIMTLKHDTSLQLSVVLISGVLVLGFIYWLLSRAERNI